MTDVLLEKTKMREDIQQRRDALTDEQRKQKSRQACEYLLKHPVVQQHQVLTLCTYMPFRSELDVTPIMEWCWKQNHIVLLPKVLPDDRKLQLHRVKSYSDVEAGVWGIMEPKSDTEHWKDEASIQLLLLPGLAFDKQGGRLGYGGGYYDRLLASMNLHKETSSCLVALAYDLQLVHEVPLELHDRRVDLVISESGVLFNGLKEAEQ